MKTVQKIVGIVPKKTKKGKDYYVIELEDRNKQPMKLFDWNNTVNTKNCGIEHICEIEYIDGEYPKLTAIKQLDNWPAEMVQSHITKIEEKATASSLLDNPLRTRLQVASMAVDLVKNEQIEVDKKIERFKEAFKAIVSATIGGA